MVFWIAIGILFILSFLWALMSLFSEINKPKQLKKIKDNLHKEKILFKR